MRNTRHRGDRAVCAAVINQREENRRCGARLTSRRRARGSALGALTLHQMNPAMADLILTSNGSAEEDYDVISDGRLVGRIFKPSASGDALDVGLCPFTP
jgi:hypothetical protein